MRERKRERERGGRDRGGEREGERGIKRKVGLKAGGGGGCKYRKMFIYANKLMRLIFLLFVCVFFFASVHAVHIFKKVLILMTISTIYKHLDLYFYLEF